MFKSLILLIAGFFMFISCNKKNASEEYIPNSDLPESFDLRETGYLTPAKNQGDLGSCWAFACLGLTEYLINKEYGLEIDLSEQHLVNCAGFGPFDGIKYLHEHGVVLEEELPYNEIVNDCNSSLSGKYKIKGSQSLDLKNLSFNQRIDSLKNTIINFGPVITHLDLYNDLGTYNDGIYLNNPASGENGGHIVIIVGYANDTSIKNGGYWACKNSWGAAWGENGYFKIPFDECNIAIYYGITVSGVIQLN
ncbi:MAG: hypothetical protein HC831_10855 [Chloroflexia bacterium]|nr:hypothetical protein [Chloroflexia bacterium]